MLIFAIHLFHGEHSFLCDFAGQSISGGNRFQNITIKGTLSLLLDEVNGYFAQKDKISENKPDLNRGRYFGGGQNGMTA
jgi:hypothetical protein